MYMAESEKIENILALSLSASKEELAKSSQLSSGIIKTTEEERIWEVIVKYNGSLAGLANENIQVEELIAGYGIITLPESYIPLLTQIEQIEYIEKPKQIYPSDFQGNVASCVTQIQGNEPFLTGRGVLVAIIDSGIDYYNDAFRNPDGTTRIVYLYDQSIPKEYGSEQINQALKAGNRQAAYELVPSRDVTGHGTAVASIAAGKVHVRGNASGTEIIAENTTENTPETRSESISISETATSDVSGVAIQSRLLVVKLNTLGQQSFPMTTNLLRAFTYVINKAKELGLPVAINLSFGNTYGSHNGTSLVERFIDNVSEIWKTCVCVGSGNEGASSGHTSGKVFESGAKNGVKNIDRNVDTEEAIETIELAVGNYERALSLQLYKSFADQFGIVLVAPSGERIFIDTKEDGTNRYQVNAEDVLVYVGFPKPYTALEEIYIELFPQQEYVTAGVWQIKLIPEKIVSGEYNLYLPSQMVRSRDTRFFMPTPERTLTIPSTSRRVITVGAYDATYESYAPFSGRGYVNEDAKVLGLTKPDLVAPGVGILAATENGMERFTGTSFAVPFVTGAVALLMEWGIERGNDPYLYGEKVKAYLIRGAKPLPGFDSYPNPVIGYGALCLEKSIPL